MSENTIFVFTSDHGYRFAQHRHYGKRLPYDRITKVPFIVSGPGIPKNQQCSELLANIDIAPTLVGLAGKPSPESCDGRSFAKVMHDPHGETLGRDAIVIENWGEAVTHDVAVPATYNSMRMQDSIYTEWASGGREYYDLQDDPEQLNNLYQELESDRQSELSEKLHQLRGSDLPPTMTNTLCQQNGKRLCGSINPVGFSGMVEADAGAEKVELEFRCVDSGEYWSEDGWASTPYHWKADLLQPNGLTSIWTCSLDTRDYASPDLQGRQTRDAGPTFEMSFDDPDTSIVSHTESKDGKQLTIRGKASGLQNVSAVRIGLLDPSTRHYWNGKLWQKEFFYLNATFAESSVSSQRQWELTTTKPQNQTQLVLVARAYGVQRQYDHTPAVETIALQGQD